MVKTNIVITRFDADDDFEWEMAIEPEDRSWVLFVPTDKTKVPLLKVAIGLSTEPIYAQVSSEYVVGETFED